HQRAIVVDITGEFVEKYYQPSCDIILNPFDPKSAQWHPWAECSHPLQCFMGCSLFLDPLWVVLHWRAIATPF
ncbi:MAG TPA: type IV secretion system DNA-binding domain-containing protein, partial [Rhabdochlamydiaceae bacterium]|nr:type IV secretion system DNA-binding domain-containing protein [Rhabdochlamydiaceae bacterium]